MDFEQILYEKNGPVLTITLNRPDKLNAYTALMQAEIIQALDAADADDDVRAIIFTGAGRGFCAGADLSGGGNTFNNDAPGRDGGLKRDGGGVLTLRISNP
jgi:enoyl-CoA hydratase/carnithine racemase